MIEEVHPGNALKQCQQELVEMTEFAEKLALALADEVAFAGPEAAEASLLILQKARSKLGLAKEFDEIESLSQKAYGP